MKIKELKKQNSLARFVLNEFTNQYGAIIFDASKGGDIADCYFYRFNKTTEIERDEMGRVVSTSGSFIDLYIDKKTQKFKMIEFVSLMQFNLVYTHDLEFPPKEIFYNPIVETSSWVSTTGLKRAFSYDPTPYLHTQDEIDVGIYHNGKDIALFKFRNEWEQEVALNQTIHFLLDAHMNLAGIRIKQKEVSVLISLLKS